MKKCPICVTGKLNQSGSHEYCDNCHFSRFTINADYFESATALLGQLLSNTSFKEEGDVAETCYYYMKMHLPMLHNWFDTVTSGRETFMQRIVESAKAQAINLQIAEDVHNPETAARELKCQCGNDSFTMAGPGELICDVCTAEYEYSEDEGIYTPYFLCSCGQASYDNIDESGLVQCGACRSLYMHDEINKVFRKVVR